MPPPSSERMSRVDHAWLRMDNDTNLMMIVGFWLLAPKLTLAELTERIRSALLAYPRFVQKVVEDHDGAMWVEDVAFDIGHHVTREALRHRAGEAPLEALKRRVAELATQPLYPTWTARKAR
jgi:diacylglycerol O-acyltransferase / wax synthase